MSSHKNSTSTGERSNAKNTSTGESYKSILRKFELYTRLFHFTTFCSPNNSLKICFCNNKAISKFITSSETRYLYDNESKDFVWTSLNF